MWLNALRKSCLVVLFASMNAEFGILSGPVALFLFSFLIASFSFFIVSGRIRLSSVSIRSCFISSSIIEFCSSYLFVGSLALYRCS